MKNLFDKTVLKTINLKNRFFRSATWEGLCENGFITENLINQYTTLAQGGSSCIITGFSFIKEDEQPMFGMIGASDDKYIDGMTSLTKTVHNNNCNIVLQIAYGGTQTKYNIGERIIWGPSNIIHKHTQVEAKEMTIKEIAQLIDLHTHASLRAKKANFDGVQIHCAHGYTLSQFLSPYYNKRNDEYGGCIENRARIIIEIIKKIKELCGNNFPIMIKLNSSDFTDEGFTFEECKYVCKELEKAGIDAIEISGGMAFNPPEYDIMRKKIHQDIEKQSYFKTFAEEIAKIVNIPIILVGGNRDFNLMNNILNSTDIKYFSLSRPLLSEPDLINKWITDNNYIPECIACNRCMSRQGSMCILRRKARLAREKDS